jgi:biopolymer transport protein TolR
MGINIANNSSASRNGRKKLSIVSEINVTPLVDVMLVLLVIFMVTTPMMIAGVDVDLPSTKSNPLGHQDEPISVTIDKSGEIYIMNTKVKREELTIKLQAILGEKKDTMIFVRGDKNVSYGDVVQIVSDIGSAGFSKVSLVTTVK